MAMINFSNTALGRFRFIAVLEGISYLLLLFIAMPLKYFANFPEAVKYTGWAHGLLFVIFGFLLIQVWISRRWPFLKVVLAFVASLLPFGTFVLDKYLRKEEAEIV